MHQGMVGGGRKRQIHTLMQTLGSSASPQGSLDPLCPPLLPRAAPRVAQTCSHPDTLRFRLPLFPSYYGNWLIYVTNEIFCLKPLIACLLLPPILLLSTINSARLGKWAVQSSPLLTGSMAGIHPCCKDITHQQ